MAIDTSFGEVRKFEDFLVTVIADLPEIDIVTVGSGSGAVVSGGADGRYRLDIADSDDDDKGGVSFGAGNWTAGDAYLKMEARIILSNLTDNRYFTGFGDTIVSADETMWDIPADVAAIGTQSDSIGIFFDNDATTKVLWAVAAATDSVTVAKALDAKYNPVAAIPTTIGCYLSQDRKSAVWYVDGVEVYRLDSATVLVAAVDLVPCVIGYEQGTSFNLDVDYLYAAKGRSTT